MLDNQVQSVDTDQPIRIAVCVITCLRPEGLRRLLEGLEKQEFRKNRKPNICIAIVDNDADGSAKPICEKFTQTFEDVNLLYEIEKQRGIPFARNHSVNMVKNQVDFIAILDDDEVPDIYWLDELMTAQREFDADILTGPVKPYLVDESASWLQSFFGSGHLPNGHLLFNNYDYVYTSNLFARAQVFNELNFDERFGASGADDTFLFMQVFKKGFKAIWADNALVTEWLPRSRTNPQWLWKRSYSKGNRFALCELTNNASLIVQFTRAIKGCVHTLRGCFAVLLSIGRTLPFIRGIQSICLGVGMITGSIGWKYQEYKEIHRV